MPSVIAARRQPVALQSTRNLRWGSRGSDVTQLQRALQAAGINPGPVDGLFGPKTYAAVRAYQASRHLTVDGVVGPQTMGALNRGAGVVAPSAVNTDSFTPGGQRVTGYVNGRPTTLTVASVGNGKYLRSDAAAAFNRMAADARAAGVNLSVTSGFRTQEQQQYLYNLYRSGRGNLAARPGYSNHQGGLSADLGGLGGYGTRAYNWLRDNASRYGFRNDVGGEPWHWTYRG